MSLSDKARKKAKAKALTTLRKEGFDYVMELSQGRFSTVMAVSTPRINHLNQKEPNWVVAKVTTDVRDEVTLLWREFRHKNVVPLNFGVEVGNLEIMVMPHYRRSLDTYLVDPTYEGMTEFGCVPGAFQKTISWLRDIAEGLSYLHGQEVCHLNLQPSNILIDYDMTAVIGGFGFIQRTYRLVTNYNLPRQYSPPECWTGASEDSRPPVAGIPYDMWSFGMLAFNIWTDYTLENRLWGLKDWKIDLYPHLFYALQFHGEDNFRMRIANAFPFSEVTSSDAESCLNFLRGLFCRDPLQRPKILQHHLLSGEASWFETDPIWEKYQDGQSGVWSHAEIPMQETSKIDASGECEESLPPETSAGVRSWLRKKWMSVKAFFGRKTPSN